MKRRIIALSLAMVMLLGIFTACDKKKANGRKDSQEQSSEAADESETDNNGDDTYDDPFQVNLDVIKSMKTVSSSVISADKRKNAPPLSKAVPVKC